MGPERRSFLLAGSLVQHLTSLETRARRRGRAWPTNPALRTTSPNAPNEDPCEPFARMNHTRSDTPPLVLRVAPREPDQAFHTSSMEQYKVVLEPRTTIARRKTRPAFIGRQHASALARGAPRPRTAGESAGRGEWGGGKNRTYRERAMEWMVWESMAAAAGSSSVK